MKIIITLMIATFLCSCEYIFKLLDGKCDHGWHTDYSEHPSNTRAYGRKIKVHIKNKTSTLYKNNGFYIVGLYKEIASNKNTLLFIDEKASYTENVNSVQVTYNYNYSLGDILPQS